MDDFFTLSDDFKIWLSFSLFRDWREVEADDANGVRRRGIFIPYLQNGIHITALHPWQKPGPVLTLVARRPKKDRIVSEAVLRNQRRMMITYIPTDSWREMVREGLVNKDCKWPGIILGYAYPLSYHLPGEDEVLAEKIRRGYV